jgi:hypothetical protein
MAAFESRLGIGILVPEELEFFANPESFLYYAQMLEHN